MPRTVALLFDSGAEGLVGRTRTEAARLLARRLLNHPGVKDVVVATPTPAAWSQVDVHLEPDPPGPWTFGQRLEELASACEAERVLYFSGGSGLLLSDSDLDALVTAEPCAPPFAILNNFFSTDFLLFSPPCALPDLARDNPLGIRLWQLGYRCYELPRSAGTQFDIDTPGELRILALHPELPAELRAVLSVLPTQPAQALLEALVDPEKEVVVMGRVGGHLLRWLERHAACRMRIVSEERGMESSGRAERGAVRSLLGVMGRNRTPAELVTLLGQYGDVVVWDTRVYMAHLGVWPPPEERFASDLLEYDKLGHPQLRDLIRACAQSPTPFLLGGHALVSGGLYLASELAWRGVDREPRFGPLPLPGREDNL